METLFCVCPSYGEGKEQESLFRIVLPAALVLLEHFNLKGDIVT